MDSSDPVTDCGGSVQASVVRAVVEVKKGVSIGAETGIRSVRTDRGEMVAYLHYYSPSFLLFDTPVQYEERPSPSDSFEMLRLSKCKNKAKF